MNRNAPYCVRNSSRWKLFSITSQSCRSHSDPPTAVLLKVPQKHLTELFFNAQFKFLPVQSLPWQSLHKVVPHSAFWDSRPWRQWEAVCCVPALAIACFLPLAGLKFSPDRAQTCLSFSYHDSLSSYSVVNTLDLVLNDGEDSLKALRYLEKPKTQQQKLPEAKICKCELLPVLVRAARKRKINSGTSQKLECIDSHYWKVEV